MTRVLIAFDKFKDALTSQQACTVAATALRTIHPDWSLDLCPLTDGGEGFCETLTQATQGRIEQLKCSGPRGEPVNAPIGYITANKLPAVVRGQLGLDSITTLAVIEMAVASGLALLPPDQRDPWQTGSFGTGQLIKAASQTGAAAILLGVGGSATNDLGFGALAALGFKFRDANGNFIEQPTPSTWDKIAGIERDTARALPPIFIACDVTNPLLGPAGATATFGPQKGLRAADFARLEAQAARLAAMLCADCGQPFTLSSLPGTGAAGGISFGLMVAFGAKLVSGFDLVSGWLDLPARVAHADLVLTGEGRFDRTSLGGKGPGSLVTVARQLGKHVHVFAGSLGPPENSPELAGVKAHAITPADLPLREALPRSAELLATAVRDTF